MAIYQAGFWELVFKNEVEAKIIDWHTGLKMCEDMGRKLERKLNI